MKKQRVKLAIFMLLIVLAAFVFTTGIPLSRIIGVYDIEPTHKGISYGLDLTGGVYVVFEAAPGPDGPEVTQEVLDKAVTTIRNRIDAMGLKEPVITKQGTNQIRVSIPDIHNQQDALDTIGKTAMLEFVSPDGEVILTGANVVNASYENIQSQSGLPNYTVKLEFDQEGIEKFAEATEKYLNQAITITLDGEVVSSPTVQSVITDGNASITNISTEKEALRISQLIRSGALPMNFIPVQVETIGPTLGQDSLQKSIIAGGVGILLVIAFMLAVYRLPGLAADMALLVYMILFLNVMAMFKVTFTLPGIAGIILSVGMAVDANVIIFERIKEEIRSGKSVAAAVDSGFNRALTSIIDSNITTVIAGAALFAFGSGSVKGFSITLIIGVLISFLTAVTVSKRLILIIVRAFKITSPSVFGIKEAGV